MQPLRRRKDHVELRMTDIELRTIALALNRYRCGRTANAYKKTSDATSDLLGGPEDAIGCVIVTVRERAIIIEALRALERLLLPDSDQSKWCRQMISKMLVHIDLQKYSNEQLLEELDRRGYAVRWLRRKVPLRIVDAPALPEKAGS
jgi:hypothetical protein